MKKDELQEDILTRYIDPEKKLKAPEGFSLKVMSHIYMEAKPVRAENKLIVPIISAAVFLVLAAATMLVTERSFNLPELHMPVNFDFSFPDLSSRVRMPQISLYVIAGVVLITLLDSVLTSRFRREKK